MVFRGFVWFGESCRDLPKILLFQLIRRVAYFFLVLFMTSWLIWRTLSRSIFSTFRS